VRDSLRAAQGAPQVVLFDFDGVLVAGDSFAHVLRTLIRERWWRRALALAVTPIAMPLLLSGRHMSLGAAIYQRVALLGEEAGAFDRRLAGFAQALARNPARVHAEAIAALRAHVASGDRVLVVSGSEQRLVGGVLAAQGIHGVEVVASQLVHEGGKWRVARHCYGARKVEALAELGIERWEVAYTDSLSDLPMLAGARRAVLVNASDALLERATRRLGRAPERLRWR
jgi:phosphatidylglycerophosphatase C